MFVQPIDYLLVVWFVLAAVSTLYVAIDQTAAPPVKRSNGPKRRNVLRCELRAGE
jgi:hypothetical protein